MSSQSGVAASSLTWYSQEFFADGTWICPAAGTYYEVEAIGGGGGGASGMFVDGAGGANPGSDGTVGGNSTFGALVTAAGGSPGKYNAASAATGTQRGVTPQAAATPTGGGIGTIQPGAPPVNGFGAGGCGGPAVCQYSVAQSTVPQGGGGNSGEIKFISGTTSANKAVTVGLGGAAAGNAQAGQQGRVLVRWLA